MCRKVRHKKGVIYMKRRSKVISALMAAAIVSAMSAGAGAASEGENLLTNPDASGGLKGWKGTDKSWKATASYEGVEPNDGKFFAPKGFKCKDGESTCIYQDIPLKNLIGQPAPISDRKA